jgi:hypothetical protein
MRRCPNCRTIGGPVTGAATCDPGCRVSAASAASVGAGAGSGASATGGRSSAVVGVAPSLQCTSHRFGAGVAGGAACSPQCPAPAAPVPGSERSYRSAPLAVRGAQAFAVAANWAKAIPSMASQATMRRTDRFMMLRGMLRRAAVPNKAQRLTEVKGDAFATGLPAAAPARPPSPSRTRRRRRRRDPAPPRPAPTGRPSRTRRRHARRSRSNPWDR